MKPHIRLYFVPTTNACDVYFAELELNQAKFRGLTLVQTMDNVAVDASLSKGGIISFECKSKLQVRWSVTHGFGAPRFSKLIFLILMQINNDTPRKILQVLYCGGPHVNSAVLVNDFVCFAFFTIICTDV